MSTEVKKSETKETKKEESEVKYPILFYDGWGSEDGIYRMDKPSLKTKQRHWWITAKPEWGKTKWIEDQFKGQRVFHVKDNNCSIRYAPWKGYSDQEIVIWDGIPPQSLDVKMADYTFGDGSGFSANIYKEDKVRSFIVISTLTPSEIYEDDNLDYIESMFTQIECNSFCCYATNYKKEEPVNPNMY